MSSRSRALLGAGPPVLPPCWAALATIHLVSAAGRVGSAWIWRKVSSWPPRKNGPLIFAGSLMGVLPGLRLRIQVSPSRLVQLSDRYSLLPGPMAARVLTYQ